MLVREFGRDAVGYLGLDLQGASREARLAQVWFCLVAKHMEWPGKATCFRVKKRNFSVSGRSGKYKGGEKGEKINSD